MDFEKLVTDAQRGSDEAFCQLIFQHKIQLYKIAYTYFKNEQDALEAVQETTCRAYQNIKKLKNAQYFKTWLIRILINYCIDEQRKRKKLSPLTIEAIAPDIGFDEYRAEIEDLIYHLKPEYRQVLILKYFEDLTLRDIAEIMERPEGTIKTWLNKGLESLRLMLSKEEKNYA